MQYEEESITYLPEDDLIVPHMVRGAEVYPIGSRRSTYVVRVGSAPSGPGSGTIALTGPGLVAGVLDGPDDLDAPDYQLLGTDNQALGYLKFTFTAKADLQKGSDISLTLPPGAVAEFANFNFGGGDGELTVSGPVDKPTPAAFTGDTRTVTVRTNAVMREGNTITFTYKDATLPDILDTADITTYPFTIKSLVPLDDSNESRQAETTDGVEVDGSMRMIAITRPHATGEMVLGITDNNIDNKFVTGADLGDITLTYAPQGGMSIGAQVEVDIPDVWGPIFLDNGDQDFRPGEVTLVGISNTSALEIMGRTLIAKATDAWTSTNTVTFTIRNAKAPTEQGTYTFPARASSGEHGTPGAIGGARDVEVTAPHGSGTIVLRKRRRAV